ncbi:MAG: hypothetical protein R6U46_12785 [Marinilabilia sp.]
MSPGFVSTGMDERHAALGPGDDEFYYTIRNRGDISLIVASRFNDGFWEFPELVSFSGKHHDASPFVTPDGDHLYFVSKRPQSDDDTLENWNIWRCRRTSEGEWGEPEILPFCSEERNELSVTLDQQGTLYFHADYESETVSLSPDAYDIFCVELLPDGSWGETEKLDSTVNTAERQESFPAISPDGNLLVFSSVRRQGYGNGDLYVSFREEDGWSKAENLGRSLNSSANDCCPSFTPDGRLVLFTSYRKSEMPDDLDYSEIKKWVLGPGNGQGDIWYFNVEALESFREDQSR